MSAYSGNVSHVEEVVDLSWCWEELLNNSVIHLNGRLSHDISNRLHLFLKILQFLVDHAAKDSLDLRLLFMAEDKTNNQTQCQGNSLTK